MSEPIFQFDGPPRLGTEIRVDGQVYLLIGEEPHQRQDGEMTMLLVWSTECAQCSVPMLVRSTVAVRSLIRRCAKHKRPGQRVGGRRRHCPPKIEVLLPAADGTLVPFRGA